jgi:uncharacterized protein
MDRKLIDILCCPVSKQPLALLADRERELLNKAIATGDIKKNDGNTQFDSIKEGLITHDHRTVYRIDDGIPVMLHDEAISTLQIADFPR